jgi:hypothetical protein
MPLSRGEESARFRVFFFSSQVRAGAAGAQRNPCRISYISFSWISSRRARGAGGALGGGGLPWPLEAKLLLMDAAGERGAGMGMH